MGSVELCGTGWDRKSQNENMCITLASRWSVV